MSTHSTRPIGPIIDSMSPSSTPRHATPRRERHAATSKHRAAPMQNKAKQGKTRLPALPYLIPLPVPVPAPVRRNHYEASLSITYLQTGTYHMDACARVVSLMRLRPKFSRYRSMRRSLGSRVSVCTCPSTRMVLQGPSQSDRIGAFCIVLCTLQYTDPLLNQPQ